MILKMSHGSFKLTVRPQGTRQFFVTRKNRGCCDRHKEESLVDPVGGNIGVESVGS